MSKQSVVEGRLLVMAVLAGCASILGASAPAAAQPDIRNIRPVVMLLVDTSGSMEWETGQPNGTEPSCTGSSASDERSRWATVVEALTGSWSTFTCQRMDRTTAYPGQVDQYYRLPHFALPTGTQTSNGILDTYLDRAKFGLMTVDSTFGLESVFRGYVPEATYRSRLAEAASVGGMYSYGEPRELTFPGCTTTMLVDGGARNASAANGALISVGSDTNTLTTNTTIQSQILAARPSWGTANGALLEDLRYYLANDPDLQPASDSLASCRPRFAVLITDGQDDDYFRETGCGTGGTVCPYATASEIADELCQMDASGTCTGDIDGVFVVGFGDDEDGARVRLEDIADRGGTDSAWHATDRASLVAAISAAIDRANVGTTSRTAPAFATGSGAIQQQFQFNSGFEVSETAGEPWSGVLERTRYVCDSATQTPVAQAIDPSQDSFHTILNERTSSRVLYTVATPDPDEMSGVIIGTDASLAPLGSTGGTTRARGGGGGGPPPPLPTRVTGQVLSSFDTGNSALTPAHFGMSGGSAATLTAQRNAVIDWVHGRSGTVRFGNRMGDIYHSNPVTVGPPRADLADEFYNLFRRRTDVATRPTVLYVGTNDGVLHCFATEDLTVGTRRIRAGEEIWGFIPPDIVPKLESAMSARTLLVDGTPVVQDVFYQRLPGALPTSDVNNAATYRTVLVMGLRGGGDSYFALDVTDPLNPEFLWQYTAQYMGYTYARAAIGQVLVTVGGVLQERAIALLPGGAGDIDIDAARTTGPVGCPAQGIGQPPVTDGTLNARSRQRCWGQIGRDLTWVDMVTGETLFSFNSSTFNAPVTGGVSLFTGATGTIATRAFMTDDDGVLWRIDMSNPNTAQWSAAPFHDIFWDGAATTGQPAYEPPLISTDETGRVVVVQATGNIDALDDPTAENRVVSLTEILTTSGTTTTSTTSLNWEIRLRAGEQVTGPLDLFDGKVYFGSFESTSSTDACSYGQSRIWGVDYLEDGGSAPTGYTSTLAGRFPLPAFESVIGSGTIDSHYQGPFLNQVVVGVAVTQQITCVDGTLSSDPYIGSQYQMTNTGAPSFQLVAQMSGATGTGSTGSSTVRTQTTTLTAPPAYTRVHSWVPQADH
jgi:type IV pilus assembly protein PilY1